MSFIDLEKRGTPLKPEDLRWPFGRVYDGWPGIEAERNMRRRAEGAAQIENRFTFEDKRCRRPF